MRKFISILLLWFVLLIPVSVQAQSQLHLSLVNVDIWPEYDRAAVLTIDHITLAPDTVLPASLTLRVPLGAEINAVAVANTAGNLINAPYDSTDQAPWSVLTITTTSLQVQVEYYTALIKDGITRHISYAWAGDYAVDKMEIDFLRPLGAGSPTISLPPVDTTPGQDGLTNYRMEAADLKVGMPFALTIKYFQSASAGRFYAWTGYPRACLNDRHFALGAGGNRIVVDRCRYSRFRHMAAR